MRIGLLHPGEMGTSVGRALLAAGHEVCWCNAGRSPATAARAADFTAYPQLPTLTAEVDGLISVCPPDQALDQAQAVAAAGYTGIYVDANAVAPATARQMAAVVGPGYVDGGIIGPPAVQPGTTRLYLSGADAAGAQAWFSAELLQAVVVGESNSDASALKMAYAAYTKGSSALLLAVNALAEQAGVRAALLEEWALSQPGLAERSEQTARATSRKAWRFAGEMEEIAQTFDDLQLPGDFHRGAAALYARMSGLKDQPPASLDEVLRLLAGNAES